GWCIRCHTDVGACPDGWGAEDHNDQPPQSRVDPGNRAERPQRRCRLHRLSDAGEALGGSETRGTSTASLPATGTRGETINTYRPPRRPVAGGGHHPDRDGATAAR